MHPRAMAILDTLKDDVIGRVLTGRSVAFAFDARETLASPESVFSLARIGQRTACYVPLKATSVENVSKVLGPTLGLTTAPYRRRDDHLTLAEHLHPLTNVSLPLRAVYLGPYGLGLDQAPLEECYAAVRVFPASRRSKLRPPEGDLRVVSDVSVEDNSCSIDQAVLALEEPCARWIESLNSVAATRETMTYCRQQSIEEDERVETRDLLASAADAMRGLFE
jgi:hypothetical protein